MGLEVELINLAEVQSYLDRIPDKMLPETKQVFRRRILSAHRQVQVNLSTKLRHRTGSLARSMGSEVEGTHIDNIHASIYSALGTGDDEVVYAPVHEYGAEINPKNFYKRVPGGPYLNLPTKDNLTLSGVMRKSAKDVFMSGGYVRPIGRGRWAVFLKKSMMFFLHPGPVKIEPRLGMHDAMDAEVPTLLSEIVEIIGEK